MRLNRPGSDVAFYDIDVDLADPLLYAEGDPHAVWRHLRQVDPVCWRSTADGLGYWSVVRHADVDRVLRNHTTFTSTRGTFLNVLGKNDPASGKQLAATDPPNHTAMRSPLQHALSIRSTAEQDGMIRRRVREVLDPALERESIDLAELTSGLPVAVLGTMMGLPGGEWSQLTELARMAVAPDEWQLPKGPAATLQRAHRSLFAYFQDEVHARRGESGSDLMSALENIHVDGEPDLGAVISNCYSLMIGAATWPYAPAVALVEMAARGRYQDWSRRPSLMDTLVEEALRWASPANHFLRHTTTDTQLGGVELPAGAPVVVWLGSANRDESVFDEPYTFDPARQPNRHLAFGSGPHNCLGSALARRMLRVVFEEVFASVEDLVLTAEPRHIASNFVAGYRTAPAAIRVRATAGSQGDRT